MFKKLILSVGLFLAVVQAQQAVNCDYQSLKCGSVLLGAPYGRTNYLLILARIKFAS
jgi:hypothetical protein